MIRKLSVTATQVKATVAIGTDEWGGYVTTDVVLPRKADEVQGALVTLENLCLRTAQTHVRTARDRRELDQLVERGIGAKLEKERQRLQRDAAAAAERKAIEADAQAERERQKYERSQREQSELRTRIDTQAAELMRAHAARRTGRTAVTLIIRTTGIEDYLDGGEANVKALILGAPSAGKTRSASFWPDPIFADCEKGRMSIADRKIPYAEIGSSADMDALLAMLKNECRKPVAQRKYKTLVIDTVDSYQRIVITERLDAEKKEALSGWGDWGYLDGKMTQFVAKLQALPMNIVVNVHVKENTTGEDEAKITTTGVKLKGDFKDQIAAEFDLVGFMGTYWEAEGGERVLKRGIQWWPDPTKPILKDRSGQLPKWTPVTFTDDDFGNLFATLISHLDSLGESEVLETLETDAAVTHEPVPPTPGGPVAGAPVIPPTAAKKAAAAPAKKAAPPAKAAEPAQAKTPPAAAPAEAAPAVETPTPVAVPAAPKPSVPAAAKPEIGGADAAPPASPTEPTPPVEEPVAAAPEPDAATPAEEPMTPEAVAEALGGEVVSEDAPADPEPTQEEAPAEQGSGTVDQGSDGATVVATCGTPSLPPEELEPGFVPVQGCGKTLDAEPNPDLVEIGALKTRTNLCNACFAAYRASATK